MKTCEFYIETGGSYEDAIHRMMSDALVRRFLLKFPKDTCFTGLKASFEAGLYDDAFDFAHSLKGLSGTLSLDRLTASVSALTDALRPANRKAFSENALCRLMQQVEADYALVLSVIPKLEQ